jgi:NAD(P)-dependent dehydrogenase (short-subunit alcohol dehydrogenase family)
MDLKKLFGLEGRVALVTGGSKNLGRHMAEGLIAAGAKVYITSRKAETCEQTAAELGPNCIPLPMDVSTVESCRALAAALGQRESKLDILINNAGAAWAAPFDEFPENGWDKVMDLNVKTPFFLTQALHPLLKAAATPDQPAKVIMIGSVDGLRLNPWQTYSYHASKSAIHYLGRRLAADLVVDHINVNSIAPGAFASDMNRAARDHGNAVAKRIPNGRIGLPEDMAAAAVYLASNAGNYVVGETIAVDGGVTYANMAGGSIDA